MPPLASKGKGKSARDAAARRSRSRNTTPSSVLSAGTVPSHPPFTSYHETDTSKLLVPQTPQYSDVIDRLESKPGVPDVKQLEVLVEQLRSLSESAEARAGVCDAAMRQLALKRKEVLDEDRIESERLERENELRRSKVKRDTDEGSDEAVNRKGGRQKKRKDRNSDHGADGVEVKLEEEPEKVKFVRAISTPGPMDSPSPSKKAKLSPGTSSLSEIAQSPPDETPDAEKHATPSKSDVQMDDSDEDHVLRPPPPVTQHSFFPDPLAEDPIVYHIRDVTPEMTDEEKKEIYSVMAFPTKDLSDQIAGTPPDKDFSNAKPTNQVAATTFLTYVEPYVRPLTEEDMAFLRERGDRTTPFLAVPRGKRHYTEIWAEEDGDIAVDSKTDKFPPNQPRGNVDQVTDENVLTDAVSQGPLASRLLSLLRFEHRSPTPVDVTSATTNGINGPDSLPNGFPTGDMDLDGLGDPSVDLDKPPPVAASVADLIGSKPPTSLKQIDYTDADNRIRAELQHLGFLSSDANDAPDYNAHHDDDISVRLRLLQAELRRVMIVNGARKARLLDVAKERLAYQEYSTIHEDLDSQVQTAYLKRTRTLGKTKKAGPGVGKVKVPGGVDGIAVSRARDIGDNARMLMDRRRRWEECIGPVFRDMKRGVPGKGEVSLWDEAVMRGYDGVEGEEGWDDEGE